jgi:leucyl/phenylalanyl-tRNA--protein transferase
MSLFLLNDLPRLYYIGGEEFPDPFEPYEDGLIGISSRLSVPMLVEGYSKGFFPWYQDDMGYFHWFRLDERMLIFPGEVTETKKLRQKLRSSNWEFKFNTRFEEVIEWCSKVPRRGESGTWINDEFIRAYTELHRKGYAVSVESYYKGELVGGFYGVWINNYFSGESMFHLKPDASKLALIFFGNILAPSLGIEVIDCQVPSGHLGRMGGKVFKPEEFIPIIQRASGYSPRSMPSNSTPNLRKGE